MELFFLEEEFLLNYQECEEIVRSFLSLFRLVPHNAYGIPPTFWLTMWPECEQNVSLNEDVRCVSQSEYQSKFQWQPSNGDKSAIASINLCLHILFSDINLTYGWYYNINGSNDWYTSIWWSALKLTLKLTLTAWIDLVGHSKINSNIS